MTSKTQLNDAPCRVVADVEFVCEQCGPFEVLKSKSTLKQLCSWCGKTATATRIVTVTVVVDGKWVAYKLQNN